MKNVLKKFISFILIVTLFLGSTISAFGNNQNIIYENLNSPKEIIKTESELREKYYIKSEIDTPYGKAYLMIEKSKMNQYETRAVGFWDLVDIGMAVSSWAKLFGEPSWENAGWAVLDTISLAPLIPGLKTLKSQREVLEKIKEYASRNKENFQRVLSKFKVGKYEIEKVYKLRLFPITLHNNKGSKLT